MFLITQTRLNLLHSKFSLIMPRKLIKDWNDDEWNNMKNSKIRIQITQLQRKISAQRKNGDINLVVKAITNYE